MSAAADAAIQIVVWLILIVVVVWLFIRKAHSITKG